MYRYAALIWNGQDPEKTAAAHRLSCILLSSSPEWQKVVDLEGLLVVQAGAGLFDSYVLPRESGVVLGRLFHKDVSEGAALSKVTFREREAGRILSTHGRRLTERYWGRYLAFLRTARGVRCDVVRDPTGGLQCFRAKVAKINVIFSDIEDLVSLGDKSFRVDWEHVAAFLHHVRMVTRSTGFKGITQIYAGECLEFDAGRTTSRFHWDPVSIYNENTIESPMHAGPQLKRVIQSCVHAWASCCGGNIVHQLSGGLDSSVVLSCLLSAPSRPRVTCINFRTEARDGDERSFARAVARKAGCRLFIRKWRGSKQNLKDLLNHSRFATPTMARLHSQNDIFKETLVHQCGATAIFSGQGGDHLFHSRTKPFLAAEYLHRHGLDSHFVRIIRDTGRLLNMPVWSVIRSSVLYGLLGRCFDPYEIFRPPPFLSVNARNLIGPSSYRHPWVQGATDLPKIKLLQIHDVVDVQPFNSISVPYADLVHPLISQPIIECCLQIPIYVLTRGGTDRALVREGFLRDLPSEVIERTSKGGTSSYFNRIVVNNRTFLRELLLEGLMAKEGMLDTVALAKSLSEPELVRGTQLLSILAVARAEAWLRSWSGISQASLAWRDELPPRRF